MRRIFFLISLSALIVVSCDKSAKYELRADILGANNLVFDLKIIENNRMVTIDSAISKNDGFVMKGSLDYPRAVILEARNTPYQTSFYMDNSNIQLKGILDSLDRMEITGSGIHDDYLSLSDAVQPVGLEYTEYVNQYQIARQKNDEAMMAEYENRADSVYQLFIDLQERFVRDNPSSFFSPIILASLMNYLDVTKIEELVNDLAPEVAAIPPMIGLKESLVKLKLVSVGQKAPDFTLNDPDGNPVSLYSKVGTKLLLVDFWAGWCGPCRQENPNVVKVYNDFKNRGFDVFGVSLDRTKDEWTNAIANDKLTWTHVSDLQYWNSAAAQLYSINSIPANFLLDENGTIIARDLRGEDLYNKVREILQ